MTKIDVESVGGTTIKQQKKISVLVLNKRESLLFLFCTRELSKLLGRDAVGVWWVEALDAAEHPIIYRTVSPLPNRKLPGPKVNRVIIEKS